MNAKQIRAARKRLKLTKAEFARRIGVTRGAVSHWEKGNRNVSVLAQTVIRNLLEAQAAQ